MLKLGTIVTDEVTGMKGMLTIFSVDMNDNQHYLFQPSSLNPENQQPVPSLWINEKRIIGGENISRKLPFEILGTHAEDRATGFAGTVTQLHYFLNGCIHVEVTPKGTIKKTGDPIKGCEFDIRRLKGKLIPVYSEEQHEKSLIETPSPEPRPQLTIR